MRRASPALRRSATRLAALAIALCSPACSGTGNAIVVHPVRGRVLLNGQPLSGVLVAFHPADPAAGDLRPHAQTDPDGRFTLVTPGAGTGAPAGEYAVAVVEVRSGTGEDETRADIAAPRASRRRPPPRYARPDTSGLRVRVAAGDNDLEPFRLTSSSGLPVNQPVPEID